MSSRNTNPGTNNTPSNLITQIASNSFVDNSPSLAAPLSHASMSHTPINLAEVLTPCVAFTPQVRHMGTLGSQDPEPQLNRRSCAKCHRRKFRCNKRQPCSNCVKAGLECVFPAPGRAPRSPRRESDGMLLGRLRHLEGIVESVGGCISVKGATPATSNTPAPSTGGENGKVKLLKTGNRDGHPNVLEADTEKTNGQGLHEGSGRFIIGEGTNRYVSNTFCVTLEDEVGRYVFPYSCNSSPTLT